MIKVWAGSSSCKGLDAGTGPVGVGVSFAQSVGLLMFSSCLDDLCVCVGSCSEEALGLLWGVQTLSLLSLVALCRWRQHQMPSHNRSLTPTLGNRW